MPGKVEIKRRENRCILRIVKAKVEYEGEYACIVDGDETYCELSVEEPNWYFTRELRPQEALEGDASATFECDVSEREAEVRWYKGDKVRARSFPLFSRAHVRFAAAYKLSQYVPSCYLKRA